MSILPMSQSISPVSVRSQVTPAASIVSSSASSRTLTALPGGAVQVDDTFVRRSIIQPNNWVQCISGAQTCAPSTQAEAPPAAAPKRRKKKRGFRSKLKRGLRKLGKVAKKGLNIAKDVALIHLAMMLRKTPGVEVPR